jgi:GcrA cell cycle regulator
MWTKERVESLKKLWADGLSARRISHRMGGVSRNAVMGKVHRLGLPGRATAFRQQVRRAARFGAHGNDRNGVGAQAVHTPLQYQLPLFETEPAPREKIMPRRLPARDEQRQSPISKAAKRRIKLLDLQDGMCRWPLGDPNAASFHFCGCQTDDGPYCAHHTRLAHQERKRAK